MISKATSSWFDLKFDLLKSTKIELKSSTSQCWTRQLKLLGNSKKNFIQITRPKFDKLDLTDSSIKLFSLLINATPKNEWHQIRYLNSVRSAWAIVVFIDLPRKSFDIYIKLVDRIVWLWITNYMNDKQWLINTSKTFNLLRELFSRFDVYSNFLRDFFRFLLCCWFFSTWLIRSKSVRRQKQKTCQL